MPTKRPVPTGYFTVGTGTTPLAVFKAHNFRHARALAKSDEVLQELRRATVIGKPLLAFGAPVWVGIASDQEQAIYEMNEGAGLLVFLRKVDGFE